MLPDGSYRMSQTQAADCVGKPEINARRFLSSKAIKALLGEGYTPDSIEIESETQRSPQRRLWRSPPSPKSKKPPFRIERRLLFKDKELEIIFDRVIRVLQNPEDCIATYLSPMCSEVKPSVC
jgi:hypothetical protein